MSSILRWLLVLGIMFAGISGFFEWWKPWGGPVVDQTGDDSLTRVDLEWVSSTEPREASLMPSRSHSSDSRRFGTDPGGIQPVGHSGNDLFEPEGGGLQRPMDVNSGHRQAFAYQVREGDTLGEIAQRHLGSVAQGIRVIRARNPQIKDDMVITVGQQIIIPAVGGDEPETPETLETVDSPAVVRVHVVTSGETLSSIARKYYNHQNYTKIIEANRIVLPDPNQLSIGMELRIPR